MSVAEAHLSFFRGQWATRLVDTCLIKEQTGSAFNPTTGQSEPTFTTRYDGPALIRSGSPGDAEYGEQQTEIRAYTVFVPHDETGLSPGFLVDVTSTHDGDLDGLQLVVRNVGKDTYRTVRPLECEENQSD